MATLVYIQQINQATFLHFSVKGESFCLRDYSLSPYAPPKEVLRQRPGGHTATSIRALAYQPGNILTEAPAVEWKDSAFWHKHVLQVNQQHGIGGVPQPQPPLPVQQPQPQPAERLLDRFCREVAPLIESGNADQLTELTQQWVQRLGAIEDKSAIFNHWCNDDASHCRTTETGLGWASAMLEYCRQKGQLDFISTGSSALDFSLISMELNLGIGGSRNPFQVGSQDSIKPDGLAVRRDGGVAVLEMKGPKDESGLVRGILQGYCGLLAVYAKREMLTMIAQTPAQRRPAVPTFTISPDKPSMAVYLLVSESTYNVQRVGPFRKLVGLLHRSFPPLNDVVLFAVNPHSPSFPKELEYDFAIRRRS